MKFIRTGLVMAILALMVMVLQVPAASAKEHDAFKIGGVVALSGAYGILGESMKKGVEIAIEMRGGKVLGKPIKVVWTDSETKAQIATQKATKLLSQGVDMIFGACSSGSTLAMMKVVERKKTPLLVTLSASDRITGKDKNRYTFRTSNPLAMEVRMIGKFVKTSGVKKVYGVTADYGVTRAAWEDLSKAYKAWGLEIVGADFPPLGNKDFAIIIDKIDQSGAELVTFLGTGGDAVTFLKQAKTVDLQSKIKIVGTIIQDEMLAKATGPGALGVYSTLRYHFSTDTEANRKFVAAYKKKFGELPNQFAGEAYDGMAWWLDVVNSTGSWDKEKWVDAFEKSVWDKSVEGVKNMLPCSHQASQIGIFGVVVEGKPPLPKYTMKVINVYPVESLFEPCK